MYMYNDISSLVDDIYEFYGELLVCLHNNACGVIVVPVAQTRESEICWSEVALSSQGPFGTFKAWGIDLGHRKKRK